MRPLLTITCDVDQPCRKCGQRVGPTTTAHGNLFDLARGKRICDGKGAGRRRYSLAGFDGMSLRRLTDQERRDFEAQIEDVSARARAIKREAVVRVSSRTASRPAWRL